MNPPSTVRVVQPAPSYASFPSGIISFDSFFSQNLEKNFQEKLISSFQKFEFQNSDLNRLVGLFHDGYFNVLAKFHKAEIPIDWSPDLKIHEDAAVCASGNMKGGTLSFPHPVYMAGFTTLGGLISFCKIDTNKKGQAILSDCPCPTVAKDITENILESPLGPLFPNKKIEPVSIDEILKLNPSAGSSTSGALGEIFLNALKEIQLIANPGNEWMEDPVGTPHGSCHPIWVSLKLFLDMPVLRQTIEKERYKQWDFSGILEGSSFDWPAFRLENLPLPSGIQSLEGRADISWRYHPETKTTEVGLKNLNAKMALPALFGKSPFSLKGDGISLRLKANGEIVVHFEKVRVEIPEFPPDESKAVSFSGTFTGDVMLKKDASDFSIQETHLKLEDLSLKNLPGKGVLISPLPFALSFDLKGNVQVDYVPSNSAEPLHLISRLEGGIWGEADDEIFDAQKLFFDLSGGFRRVKDRWVPNLKDFEASLTTDLTRKKKDKEATLKGKDFWLTLSGGGSYEDSEGVHQEAVLEAGFEDLQAGKFTLSPNLYLNLISHQKGEDIRFEAEGDGSLQSESPKIDIGSDIKISTDLSRVDWDLIISQDQIFGDWKAEGETEVVGGGEIDKGLSFILNNFKIKTNEPFQIIHDQKVIAKGITLTGRGDEKGNWFYFRAPSLLGNRIDLSVHRSPGSDQLSGQYQVVPRPVTVTNDLKIEDILLKGSFRTPSIPELFEKPHLWISNEARAKISGPISGPLRASLQGSLRYDPEKKHFYLWINPQKTSQIAVGPLSVFGDDLSLEGKAQLTGTWVGVLGKYGLGVGGSGVGVKGGELFLTLKGQETQEKEKVPILSDSSMIVDQLWQIHQGVAYAGGNGIKIDLNVNLDALQGKVDADSASGRRHLLYIVDQIPLSLAGYWLLFKKMQKDQAKTETKSPGGVP